MNNLGQAKGWSAATIEKRRKHIQAFVDRGAYPTFTEEEKEHLQTTAQTLYQDILKRSTAGAKGFVTIHGEAAVRLPLKSRKKSQSGASWRVGTIRNP